MISTFAGTWFGIAVFYTILYQLFLVLFSGSQMLETVCALRWGTLGRRRAAARCCGAACAASRREACAAGAGVGRSVPTGVGGLALA